MLMTKIISIVSALILAGCATNTPIYKSASMETNNLSVSTSSKWEPLVAGSDLRTDVKYEFYPHEMKLSNNMLLRGSDWNGFLKEYIESFPIEKRDKILKGLTRFHKEYDKVDKVIRFEPLRYISDPYSSNSYVSLKGILTKSKASALLKIHYYGSSWIFADRITIVADDFTWKSPELKFYRDHYTKVWEYTFLDLSNPKYRKIAYKIASSKNVIIRFHGRQYYDDFQVPERMKQDMFLMLKAIDSINKKS